MPSVTGMPPSGAFVLFEGPDAAGKTTLAQRISADLGWVYMPSVPAELVAMRTTMEAANGWDSFHFYAACNAVTYLRIRDLLPTQGVCLDRSHFSTAAYHAALVGTELVTYVQRVNHSSEYPKPDLIVLVTADHEIRSTRADASGDMNLWFDISLREDLMPMLRQLVRSQGAPVIEVDTSQLGEDAAAGFVLERMALELGRESRDSSA